MSIDPKSLTLREAYERFYDRTDLSKASVRGDGYFLNYWEHATDNPPVGEITNQTLTAFKAAMLESGKSPASVNSVLKCARKILRVMGPQGLGNPAGLDILPRMPYTKLLTQSRGLPRRIELDDLTRFYAACRHATIPVRFVDPADWWRALVVFAYFTGLRRSDLFTLRHEAFDLDRGEFLFQARKTAKADVFPLHPLAVDHLRRIWNPICDARPALFSGFGVEGQRFYKEFRRLRELAGVDPFALHDIRRTAASEIERVKTGMARVFLQHAPKTVTEISYLNLSNELRESILSMRFPVGFDTGVKMRERAQRAAIEARQPVSAVDYLAPVHPGPQLWRFEAGRWSFNSGPWFQAKGFQNRLLRTLALSESPVRADALARVVWRQPAKRESDVRRSISVVRELLRKCLGLPLSFDPIPCTERGNGGAWLIVLPVERINARWNGETTKVVPLHETQNHRPPREFWDIGPEGYSYRGGERFPAPADHLRLLETLSAATGIVSFFQLALMFADGETDRAARDKIHARIRKLRERLKRDLGLPEGFDPVPYSEAVSGGGWWLRIPYSMIAELMTA